MPNSAATDNFTRWVEIFKSEHEGAANAYKTLFLTAGADVKVVGSDLKQMDFKVTQGAGETRIAAAAGVPPVIVGLSEGLQAATYSNYAQARRRFADGTIRPLWRNIASSLETLVTMPPGEAQLWYDDRDIPFLHEDALDATTIRQTQAASVKLLIDAGFDADSVVEAVITGDFSALTHTGLFSVQLQPPGVAATQDPTTLQNVVLPPAKPNAKGAAGGRALTAVLAEAKKSGKSGPELIDVLAPFLNGSQEED